MTVRFPISDELAAKIQRKVDEGLYPDASAAWREAIRLLLEKHGHYDVDVSGIVAIDDEEEGTCG